MTRPKAPRLYPFEPLLAAAKQRCEDDLVTGGVRKLLRVNNVQFGRFEAEGLTEAQADKLACRVGLHPSAIWPSWFSDLGSPIFERLRSQLAGTHWAAS